MSEGQKVVEREWLDGFKANVRVSPGIVGVRDHERPDFVLDLEDGSDVGMELTEVTDEGLAKTVGSMRTFNAQLRDALVLDGLKVIVHVSAREGSGTVLVGRRRDDAIVGIVRLAHAKYSQTTKDSYLYVEDEELSVEGILGLPRVGFRLTDNEGGVIGGLNAPGQRAPAVQARIDDKAGKLVEYRRATRSGRVWLLLIINSHMRNAIWDQVVRDGSYDSPFDATFWYDVRAARGARIE